MIVSYDYENIFVLSVRVTYLINFKLISITVNNIATLVIFFTDICRKCEVQRSAVSCFLDCS